jgi:cell division protein FtsL
MRMKNYVFLSVMIVSVCVMLGVVVFQGSRYAALQKELARNTSVQEELIENNKQLVKDIAELSSPERIEQIATGELELEKKDPEDVLQVMLRGE